MRRRKNWKRGETGGKEERKEEDFFLSSLPPVSPRFQFFLLRISFGKIKIDLEQV